MKTYEKLVKKLKENLQLPLPGLSEQLRLAPITRLNELKSFNIPNDAQQSAVMVLLYPANDHAGILLIKRAVDDTIHSGQVSFPGGKKEKADTNLKETALRETYEEIGIPSESISVIGTMTKLYIPPSNFEVHPFVGYLKSLPGLRTNYEVERVIQVPLKELTHPNAIQHKTIKSRDGQYYEVPCYFIQSEIVWGATAMMLSELVAIFKKKPG
jgi:8-oxo-dGTP pyrophosphatase MutT (NUDIX family)